MKFSQIQYDIPDHLGFPNPSDYLRSRAVRSQLSNWFCDRDNPPWSWIKEAQDAGCTVDLLQIEEESNEIILKRAAEYMVTELAEKQQREAKTLKRIDDALATAEADHASGVIGWDKLDAARRKHRSERKACLKNTEQVVKDLQTAAARFGLDTRNIPFQGTHDRIAGIRALNGAKATLYVQMAEQARLLRLPAELVAAAEQNELPAEILADAVEQAGGDVAAARAAFTPTHATNGHSNGATAVLEPPVMVKTSPANVVSTRTMVYDHKARRLIGEASTLALVGFPTTLAVRSHRTGATQTFTHAAENYDAEGELVSVDYDGPENLTLRVLND